jgi:hypothetical protein
MTVRTFFVVRRWRAGPPVAEVPEAFRSAFNSDEPSE